MFENNTERLKSLALILMIIGYILSIAIGVVSVILLVTLTTDDMIALWIVVGFPFGVIISLPFATALSRIVYGFAEIVENTAQMASSSTDKRKKHNDVLIDQTNSDFQKGGHSSATNEDEREQYRDKLPKLQEVLQQEQQELQLRKKMEELESKIKALTREAASIAVDQKPYVNLGKRFLFASAIIFFSAVLFWASAVSVMAWILAIGAGVPSLVVAIVCFVKRVTQDEIEENIKRKQEITKRIEELQAELSEIKGKKYN